VPIPEGDEEGNMELRQKFEVRTPIKPWAGNCLPCMFGEDPILATPLGSPKQFSC
jgi:hypothetical protein